MSSRIRIASLYRTFDNAGDENRLVSFARAVDRSRFDHVVAVLFPPENAEAHQGPMLTECRRRGIEMVYLEDDPRRWRGPTWRPRTAVNAARMVHRLVSFLRERAIDVLDARLVGAIPIAGIAGKLAGTPAIVGTQYHFDMWDRPRRRALANATWPLLDMLICDCKFRLDEIRAFLRRPPPGVVIQNGVFEPQSERSPAEMRRVFGLPEAPGVRVIGQISRLIPFKGQRVLLEAAREVLARAPDTAFLICGLPIEPAYRDELVRRAAELGDRVRVVSYMGPAADVWRAIDVHVHASLFDSSPIAIHESMSLKKPAVVTSVGGIPELVEHEVTGLIVPPGDAGALAGALLRVIGNPAEATRFAEAARARYELRHRPEMMARATEDLFERLVRERARRAR